MKRKIISFIGLLLFVGVVAFNAQLINKNPQLNEIKLKNIEALSSGGDTCESLDCNRERCYNHENYTRCYWAGDLEECHYYTECQY
jgi:hypothetical protein